jgi:4-hydroxy-tetrahydrodipicolinate synthase
MVLEGAMTALVTPMRDGGVDFDALSKLVDRQLAGGIHGLVPMGTTGESATLNHREHISVVKHVVDQVAGKVPVIGGAGANSTAEAIELTRGCEEVGVDGVLQVCPYYNKPNQDGLYRHFELIAASTKLPVVLYNVPGRTASDLLPETVERLSRIDNVVAIKEATGDMRRASEIHQRCGDALALMSGDDFTTFTLYAVGGRGVISVISNLLPDRMAKMWEAAKRGDWDEARAQHYAILPLTAMLFAEPNPAPTKACLEMMGLIGPEIRPPLVGASQGLRDRMRPLLEAEGLL